MLRTISNIDPSVLFVSGSADVESRAIELELMHDTMRFEQSSEQILDTRIRRTRAYKWFLCCFISFSFFVPALVFRLMRVAAAAVAFL